MKFLLHGCFDLLHEGHKAYIQKAISIFSNNLILGLWDDDRIKNRKGSTRPLFTFDWRKEDIQNNFPNLEVLKLTQQDWELGVVPIKTSEITLIAVKSEKIIVNVENTFTYRTSINGYQSIFLEQSKSSVHTTDILDQITSAKSDCRSKNVGCGLLRNGVLVGVYTNKGDHQSCPRCSFNLGNNCIGISGIKARPSCVYPHAEENALVDHQVGDDLIVTHSPCKKCEALIAESGIRRVVVTNNLYPDKQYPLNYRVLS